MAQVSSKTVGPGADLSALTLRQAQDHAALLAGPSKGFDTFNSATRGMNRFDFASGQQTDADRAEVRRQQLAGADPAKGGYNPKDGKSPFDADAYQTNIAQGFTYHPEDGGYSKVNGPAAAGTGSPGAVPEDAAGGDGGAGLAPSMASLAGAGSPAMPEGQAQPLPGGSLLRPTLVTRHPAVLSQSLAALGRAY